MIVWPRGDWAGGWRDSLDERTRTEMDGYRQGAGLKGIGSSIKFLSRRRAALRFDDAGSKVDRQTRPTHLCDYT